MTDRKILEEMAVASWVNPTLPTKELVTHLCTTEVRMSWDPAVSSIAAQIQLALNYLVATEPKSRWDWQGLRDEFDKQKGH